MVRNGCLSDNDLQIRSLKNGHTCVESTKSMFLLLVANRVRLISMSLDHLENGPFAYTYTEPKF